MTQLNIKRIKLITMYIMSIFYISVGINHFVEPEWFIQIVPPYLSKYDLELVYISGVFEVMFGTVLITAFIGFFSMPIDIYSARVLVVPCLE